MIATEESTTEKLGPASMLMTSVWRSVAVVPSPCCVIVTSASELTPAIVAST